MSLACTPLDAKPGEREAKKRKAEEKKSEQSKWQADCREIAKERGSKETEDEIKSTNQENHDRYPRKGLPAQAALDC